MLKQSNENKIYLIWNQYTDKQINVILKASNKIYINLHYDMEYFCPWSTYQFEIPLVEDILGATVLI